MGPALFGKAPEELEPLNEALARAALETRAIEYSTAVIALQRYARRVASFWEDVDVVLTPTLAKLPVPIGWVFEPEDPWEQFARGAELHAVHAGAQRDGPAGRVGAVRGGRRAPDRHPADRAGRRGGDADPARGAARGGSAVGRPAAARVGGGVTVT